MAPAMVATAAAAMAAAPQKKPWRYYYVMVFPLSDALPKEKLPGMLQLTDSIEKREEEYLLTMVDRESLRETSSHHSVLPGYAATTLKWSSVCMLSVSLVWPVAVYCVQRSSMGDEVDPRVFKATYIATASVAVMNAALFAAIHRSNSLLLRGAVLLLSLAVGCVAFVLDELRAVQFSQRHLASAIEQPQKSFTDDQIELVLNGGDSLSLWHRFFVDGPAWFLMWLETHCVKHTPTQPEDADDSLVDSGGFFASLWRSRSRICTRRCLQTNLKLEHILQVILTAIVVVMATQLVLAVSVLWSEHLDSSKSNGSHVAVSRKRKRQDRRSKTKGKALDVASMAMPISFTNIMRVATVALAITGTILTVVSVTLLSSCAFVGPVETWSLALVAVFGVLQVIAAIFTNLLWKQRFTKSVLVGGLALESYATSALVELCTTLTSPSFLRPSSGSSDTENNSNSAALMGLRDVYDTIFQQTCQPIKHWRRHVCVLQSSPPSPHGSVRVDLFHSSACQVEFGALLRTSAEYSLTMLWWMMAAQVVALASLLLPSVKAMTRSALATVTDFFTLSRRKEAQFTLKDGEVQAAEKHDQKCLRHTALPLGEAKRRYLLTLRHKDEATSAAAEAAFDAEWEKLSGSSVHSSSDDPTAVIFKPQFEAIVRTLILRRLTVNCKMAVSLSLSSDGKLLFAKIFASDNLLMMTLCQSAASYKLQLADAVDPGKRFWHDERELKIDAKVLDIHTVHQKFKLLQLHGMVSRQEAEIFPTESMARVSARVQALLRTYRRKIGVLAVDNRHPPFVEYVPHTHLQYLYKKYPNRLDTATSAQQRRAAVLRTIDCIRLTRQLLDTEFDLDMAQREGLIRDFTELHSASRFDATSKSSLLASWVAFWRPRHLPGEVLPQQNWLLNLLGRFSPFRQPLQAVRDYFGECIAFYFAWLAFYNQFLLLPALAVAILLATRVLDDALMAELVSFCRSSSDNSSDGSVHYVMPSSAFVFGLAVVAWGFAFAKFWERRSVWYQLEWGMSDQDELTHVDRATFRGEERLNPVTLQRDVYFSGRKRLQRQIASALLLLGVGIIHLGVCLLLLLSQGVLSKYVGLRLAVGLSMLAIALLVLWNGDAISSVSNYLSEWENYQNENDFQQGVILKVCALQVFNSYGPLLLVAFGLNHIDSVVSVFPFTQDLVSAFQQRIAVHVGVVIQLQALLLLIFATRIGSHLLLMLHGLLRGSSRASVKPNAPPSIEGELALQAYRGSYEDYTEIFVQLGLVVMFASLFPLAAVFAFVECALELRLDALDLCLFLQRPTPAKAHGIGPWEGCIRVLLKLSIVVNLALLYFMADNYADWSSVRRVGAFLGSVLVTWLASELLWILLPSRSRNVEDVLARHSFLVDRYFGGDDSREKLAQSSMPPSENERRALSDQEISGHDGPEVEAEMDTTGPSHYEERMQLLRRLDVALRKKHEPMEGDHAAMGVGSMPDTTPMHSQHETMEEEEEEEGEEEERAVVGYILRKPLAAQEIPTTTPRVPTPPPAMETPPPVVASSPTASVEQYSRTVLAGMQAIHVAAEREQFDFGQDTGWQNQERGGAAASTDTRRTSLSRRFSLFKKRRASVDATSASPIATAAASPSVAASSAVSVPESTASTAAIAKATPVARRPSVADRPRRNSGRAVASQARDSSTGALPVVQLSGLEAVHEATRRSQFDFSADPWRDSTDSHQSATL